ncbi:MAG: transcriptional repressor [Myxococcales bacterium]|nr:transcriptional repressor [Myxococcales bacterium]MCB9717609.1 transcriptional repressor [Myxococcales bacterium]
MSDDVARRLRERGIRPSVQRVAIARVALASHRHPSADEVWEQVKERLPMVSRATVYNTLNRLVEEGLLRSFASAQGHTVFDPNTAPHHHLVDDATGTIYDLPWEALAVDGVDALEGFEVRDFQVVLHGRPTRRSR